MDHMLDTPVLKSKEQDFLSQNYETLIFLFVNFTSIISQLWEPEKTEII